MLRHNAESVLVFNDTVAQNSSFFNGYLNTMKLDFDPLVNGYSFFKWTVVPSWVTSAFPGFKDMTEKNFLEGFSLSDIELETGQMTHGFAANEYNFATTTKKGNTDFSIKHREFSGSPIRNAYQYWITGIRDPETGISTYGAIAGINYGAKNHTGEIVYIVTRPDANNIDKNNIEFSCYYTAVIPTKIMLSQFAYTHGTHDAAEYEQSFKGVFHMSAQVDEFAAKVLQQKVYGFLEMGDFDPTSPDQGTENIADTSARGDYTSNTNASSSDVFNSNTDSAGGSAESFFS
jgi:hypothetical protein